MRDAAVGLLVVATLAGGWWNVRLSRLGSESRRLSLLVTAVLAGAAITIWTESLGALTALRSSALLALWVASLCALVVAGAWRSRSASAPRKPLGSLTPAEWVLVIGVGTVLATTALVALWAPPNTFDAMSYHLPRVMHWLQDRSLAVYPTHVQLQIQAPPGAEYLILNLVALGGNDRLATLVQWAAFGATTVAVSYVAFLLGGKRLAQVLAAVVFATLPMAILQSSGTKNDLVSSLWLVSLAAFVLVFCRRRTCGIALLVGLATGLALLTRPTAYLFAFPFFVWFAIAALRGNHRRGLALVAVAGATALALNAPYYARNLETYGSPLGPTAVRTSAGEFKSTNSLYRPSELVSNIVRNAALQLASPIAGADRTVERAVAKVHKAIGISENDPRTTWAGTTFALPAWEQQRFEDKAPNTVAFLLGLVAIVVYLVQRKRFDASVFPYLTGIGVGAFLFCLFIRWEPWNSRFHTPLFALAAPFIGLVVVETLDRRIAVGIGVVLLLACLPWLLEGEPRSVTGPAGVFTTSRSDQYFANEPALKKPFLYAVRDLTAVHCTHVGLFTDSTAFEYPLWPLLQDRAHRGVEFEDVAVSGKTAREARPRLWRPCALFAETAPDDTLALPRRLVVDGVSFARAWAEGSTALFFPRR